VAAIALAIALWLTRWAMSRAISEGTPLRDVITLVALVAVGGVVYGGAAVVLFGRQLLSAFRRKGAPASPPPVVE
jgi:hypothetical protein